MSREPKEKWIEAGGYRTRYLEAGKPGDAPLVLLHDGAWGGASSVTWNRVIPLLSDTFHVLAPDLLGFGGTDKAVFVDRAQYEPRMRHVRALLEALGIEKPPHLVGNSFGGSLALRWLADSESAPVRSVVAVCGTGGPWRSELSKSELAHWDGTEQDLRRVVELLIDDSQGFQDHLSERMRWASSSGHYRAVMAVSTPLPPALARPRPDDGWPHQLSHTKVPVMLVAGRDDVLLDPKWTAYLTEVVPHARVELLDGKHAPNVDRPGELTTLLRDFLGAIEP